MVLRLRLRVGGRAPRLKRSLEVTINSQRSYRGQVVLEMSYGNQIRSEEPLTKGKSIAGIKGHIRVRWGQRSNCLEKPFVYNSVSIHDQRVAGVKCHAGSAGIN